jgi:DNA repair protein RadC
MIIELIKKGEYNSALEELIKVCDKSNETALSEPAKVYEALKEYAVKRVEHFIVVVLDNANKIIHTEVVSKGTINETVVHPREIFNPAIINMGASIILAHNHPSGKLEPSKEDIQVTRRILDAGKILGIHVVDHIIMSKTGYNSLRQSGYMD